MKRTLGLIVLLIFLIPSALFADETLKTGYELYHNLKLFDDPKSTDDMFDGVFAAGYLSGCLEGLRFMQDSQYNNMFPLGLMTEEERKKTSKKMNFHQLNIPKEGIATGQLILIYKRFAEKHPKELSGSARICIWQSLVDAYGWK
jgi:opacity protein-like surface antigen